MAEQHSGTAAAAGGGERGGRHNRGRAGRSRGGRGGGRGGRSRGGAQAASTGQQNQPSEAVQAPAATQPPRADGSTPGQAQTGRGSRRTRNARRGGANTGQRTTFGAHRAFGGQLTSESQHEEGDQSANASFNVGATDFVPGQSIHEVQNTPGKSVAHGKPQRERRNSKSTAPDLPTRIHEDITYGQYECVICTNEVLPNSKIWSCTICWTVVHMSCVKKWYTNQTKKPEQPGAEAPTGWRCPGCLCGSCEMLVPSLCYCGKEFKEIFCERRGDQEASFNYGQLKDFETKPYPKAEGLGDSCRVALGRLNVASTVFEIGRVVILPSLTTATQTISLVHHAPFSWRKGAFVASKISRTSLAGLKSQDAPCHRPGECEDMGIRGSHCSQPCLKVRKSCDHVDTDLCHAPYACNEDKPCQAKTFVTCECQHRKQEIKCQASKSNPWPERTPLKCDDECLRLQRNAKLAAALNIDPATHTDDHVPYSDTTLKFFRDNAKWAQTQEREFRVFASDPSEKRLRFKPMKSHLRAFLHSLAEDFGLDSESQDPEPHRHVAIFKTPRFVSAPAKTLGQCVKIRAAESQTQQAGPNIIVPTEPYNALILSSPQFGLTIEELESSLKADLATQPSISFTTSFLPSDEIVLRAPAPGRPRPSRRRGAVPRRRLPQRTSPRGRQRGQEQCRRLEHRGREVRRATGHICAAGAPPARSKFVALLKPKKKKPAEEEPVEEDWEAAAEKLDGEK
ncbi:hypothetical protein G7054_g4596 [Neopestalotiopsis clavispora]|nr:hypothetical protein G7054_g4596 [Neopestalotiopsis clavispora]